MPESKKSKSGKGSHPNYATMVMTALKEMNEKWQGSRQAIVKYLMNHYKVGNDAKQINYQVKKSLKKLVDEKCVSHPKGVGASGSFRLVAKGAERLDPSLKMKEPESPPPRKRKAASSPSISPTKKHKTSRKC